MKNIKLFICYFSFSLLFLLFSVEAEINNKIKIGFLIPISGPFAEMGFDLKNGVELAKSLYPNVPVEFVYGDSRAENISALNEFKKLAIKDKVLALFIIRSGVGMAINPLSKEMGLPLLGAVAYDDFISQNPYAFRTWSAAKDEGAMLADIMNKSNVKKVAILNVNDDYMLSIYEGFKMRSSLYKITTNPVLEFNPDNYDFRSILPKVQKVNPDAIFANLTISHLGIFLKQLHDSGNKIPVYSNVFVGRNDVKKVAGDGIKGAVYVEPETNYPKTKVLLNKLNPDAELNSLFLSSFTATLLLLDTLSENLDIKTRQELYSKLILQNKVKLPDDYLNIVNREIQFPLVARTVN